MASPQFRVIPQAAGGVMLSVNGPCLALLIAALEAAPDGERPRDKKVREALLRELKSPSEPVSQTQIVSTHTQKKEG